jgi:hypothetical protein
MLESATAPGNGSSGLQAMIAQALDYESVYDGEVQLQPGTVEPAGLPALTICRICKSRM